MTRKRTWLALGALLTAIVGGALWAAEREKVAPPACAECPTTTDKKCCDEKKCSTKDEAKTCCEGKCCAAEKVKSCCADGKCCGCCEKAKGSQAITLPVPPGSAVQVMVAPNAAAGAYDGMPFVPPALGYLSTVPSPVSYLSTMPQQACVPSTWGSSPPLMPPQPAPPMPYAPNSQCVTVPSCGNPVPPAPPPPPVQMPPQAAEYVPVSGVSTVTGTACTILAPMSPQAVSVTGRSAWILRVVELNKQPRLMMQFDGDKDTPRVSCQEMVVHMGPEPLKVCVADRQVRVSGNFFNGSADTIGRNAANGNLVLEGHVKMHYGKEGNKVEVAAEQVIVNMSEGRVEVSGLGRAVSPTQPATREILPMPTRAPQCPVCPASGDDCHQIFNFWTGFFH